MSEEQKHSPTPWTVHTNMKPDMNGEAFIRCADEEDGILGEVVADVMNQDDAHFIAKAVITREKTYSMPTDVKKAFRTAYSQLNVCIEGDDSDDVTEEVKDQIEEVLNKYGYTL